MDSETRKSVGAFVGIDIGVANFNDYGHLSAALSAGESGAHRIRYTGQFVYSSEILLPPFWDGKPDPVENRIELNGLAGTLIRINLLYLEMNGGLGYFHEVRRGAALDADPGNTYERLSSNGIGVPIEASIGFINRIGVGLKVKGLLGRDSYAGFLLEVMGGAFPDPD